MVDWVLGIVGGLLYPLFSVLFVLINTIQSIFYAFAGIGDMSFGLPNSAAWEGLDQITSGNSGATNDTGLIYYLFNNTLVKNLLISIMLLALVLVIVFTVMAFIKNAYSAKPKGWKEIIGNAIKGLANFIFIPVCCLLGVWLGNILLNAVNGATSGLSGGSDMSRKLFIAAAYNANEFRSGKDDENGVPFAKQTADTQKVEALKKFIAKFEFTQELIGEAEYKDGEWHFLWWSGPTEELNRIKNLEEGQTNEYYATIVDMIYANTNISIYEWGMVEYWYSLWEINYIVLGAGGVFMLYALCSLAFAMVRRMFFLVVLFVISPAACALYPLDEGKAVGSWKGEFIKQVLSAYGAVAGMNIFFALVPLIDNLHLGTSQFWGHVTAIGFVDDIVQLFVLICGLLVVKELIGLISGFVGGEDAYGKGGSMFSSARSASKKYVGGAIKKTGGAFYRGWNDAKKAKADGKSGLWAFSKGLVSHGFEDAKSAFGGLVSESGLWDKKYGEEIKTSYGAYLNKQKASADKKKFGEYGEKAAETAANDYSGIGKHHRKMGEGLDGGRTSELMAMFTDEMKKVIFGKESVKGKFGAENADLTAMGIEGAYKMKVNEVMDAVGVVDNVIDLFGRINDRAKEAENVWNSKGLAGVVSGLSDPDQAAVQQAIKEGRSIKSGEIAGLSDDQVKAFNEYIVATNATRSAQDRFNQYAEAHADAISDNSVLTGVVEKVQANITAQQNASNYSAIDEVDVGIKTLRFATQKLAETIADEAVKIEENAKKAKENAIKDSAKGDKK